MKGKILLFVALSISLGSVDVFAQPKQLENNSNLYRQNRYPLNRKPYLQLPLGAIQPKGWLRAQLVTMKDGMTGNLDSLYAAVVGDRNGWLGGDGDVWERGPYWLDGLVPLAYILNDAALKAKVQPWIEWSIRNQQPDGYFGPIPTEKEPVPEPGLQKDKARDWWPKMVMLKVLKQYYEATGDERVIDLMTKYFHYQLKQLPITPLNHWSWWGEQRGGDNLMVVYWLYNITGDKSLLNLGELLNKQTYDWTNSFLNTNDMSRLFFFHGVNLAQGIKQPIVYYQQHPEEKYVNAVKKAFKDMRQYIGQPQGMFGADEMTHGNVPTQGSEFCSAVELMFSLEDMMSITGNVEFMDHLEKIAFNALPTQATDNYLEKQYFQQPNQIMITRNDRNFNTPHGGTNLVYGLLSGYPCCTCNMHQGWPKFTQHLWMATEDKGLAALEYAPSSVKAKVAGGSALEFIEETDYPFDENIKFTCKTNKTVSFPFHLRIPAWCDSATITINGKEWKTVNGNQVIKINRAWKDNDVVILTLPMNIIMSRWHENSVAVERGPLLYALKIGEDWKEVKNSDHYGDYHEVYPTTPWNYGLLNVPKQKWNDAFKVVKTGGVADNPWTIKNAPIIIQTKGIRLPNWKLYNEEAGPLPFSPQPRPEGAPPETITLVPYGCTILRISEFPVVKYK